MGEAVGAAEIDEHAEAAHAGDPAAADIAFVQLLDQALLLLHAPLLQRGALREDDAVAPPVDLDDLEPQRVADGVGQACAASGVLAAALRPEADDLRHGYEGVHAFDVDEQATLVVAA